MNNNIQNILKHIRKTDVSEIFPNTNAKAVGWGPKIKDGKETGEYALIVYVDKKQHISQLWEEQVVPSTYTAYDTDFTTDVQVQQLHEHFNETTLPKGQFVPLTTMQNAVNNITQPELEQQLAYGDCNVISDTVEPVKSNRTRRRVLRAGCESIGGNNKWGSYVATLGTFVLDKSDRQVVALSNNHVYGESQIRANITSNTYTNTSKLSAYQPSGYWKTTKENDYIGVCKRPVVLGNINSTVDYGMIQGTSCDASIVALANYDLIDNTSLLPIGFDNTQLYAGEFATNAEIDSLLNPSSVNYGAPVFRSGRTCGPIGFPGATTTCSLSVYQFAPAAVGGYGSYSANFTDSFFFRGTAVPGRGGDSGSAVLALFNRGLATQRWKIIGLLFAGPGASYPGYSIGCRITNISRDLGVIPWNGYEIPTTPTRTTSLELNSAQSNGYSATVTLSGRAFYQLGRAPVYL